jgi:hypothetical protein
MNYQTPGGYVQGYQSPGGYSPANWFGDFMGNLGNSWQGGTDAPMYGAGAYGPTGTGNPAGAPYASTTGAYVAGQAVQGAATALVAPVGAFFQGALRGVGVYVALGIVAYTLIHAKK